MDEIKNNGEMKQYNRHSERIAKNTVLLFIRMLVLMVVNLYAVRILLQRLGVVDYGIFNAVAGVVTTLSCLSSVLSVSTQRFYSVVIGDGILSQLKNVFSASVNINLFFSFIVFLIFETAGLWFLNEQMEIPVDRIIAANWLYQTALFAFIFSIWQIPFTAALIAHEDMGYYAGISTIECFLKFLAALLIGLLSIDNLVFYGIALLTVSLIILFSYVILGRSHYQECHYTKISDSTLYKRLLSFSGWTLFGSLANVGMFQGNTILLFQFFGPVATAAYGISLQIYNAFNAMCNSVVLALRPAMMRSYAEGDHDYLMGLFYSGNKFILYTLLAVAIPLIIEMPTVLALWLGDYNEMMLVFSRLIIVYVTIMILHHPITIIMQAAGLVRIYHVSAESVMLLCLPVSYFFFYLGMPAYASYISMIGVCVLAHVVRVICLYFNYRRFSLAYYLLSVLIPAIVVAIVVYSSAYYLHSSLSNKWIQIILVCSYAGFATLLLGFLLGTNRAEKRMVRDFLTSRILRKR